MTAWDDRLDAMRSPCPACGAEVNRACRSPRGHVYAGTHRERLGRRPFRSARARYETIARALATATLTIDELRAENRNLRAEVRTLAAQTEKLSRQWGG